VRYWDASAIVPLVIEEAGSDLVRRWARDDDQIVTWCLTRLELAGAVERRARQGALGPAARRTVLRRFEELAAAWDEVVEMLPVRDRGLALLVRHPLRAADAAQLAAAQLAAEDNPRALPFVCLDRALAAAADREGFCVLTWPGEQAG
jgi:predicted nucleic acid-binding protein